MTETRAGRPGRTELVVVACIALAIVVAGLVIARGGGRWGVGDATFYLWMARHPRSIGLGQYYPRFLVPDLVWLLPFSARTGMVLVTGASLVAIATIFHRFVDDTWGRHEAMFATALLFVSPVYVVSIRNPFLLEAPALLGVTVVVVLVARRRLALAALALIVAMLVKEQAVFLLLPFLLATVHRGRRAVAAWGAATVGAAVVYLVIHHTAIASPVHHDIAWLSASNVRFVVRNLGGAHHLPRQAMVALASTFGPLWLVAMAWRRLPQRWLAAYLVPVVASMVIAYDWPRVLTYAFIVLIPIACSLQLPPRAKVIVWCSTALLSVAAPLVDPSPIKVALQVAVFCIGAAVLAPTLTNRTRVMPLRTE